MAAASCLSSFASVSPVLSRASPQRLNQAQRQMSTRAGFSALRGLSQRPMELCSPPSSSALSFYSSSSSSSSSSASSFVSSSPSSALASLFRSFRRVSLQTLADPPSPFPSSPSSCASPSASLASPLRPAGVGGGSPPRALCAPPALPSPAFGPPGGLSLRFYRHWSRHRAFEKLRRLPNKALRRGACAGSLFTPATPSLGDAPSVHGDFCVVPRADGGFQLVPPYPPRINKTIEPYPPSAGNYYELNRRYTLQWKNVEYQYVPKMMPRPWGRGGPWGGDLVRVFHRRGGKKRKH